MPEFMVQLTTASLPGSEAAEQPQTVTPPPPNVSVGVMFCYCSLLLFIPSSKNNISQLPKCFPDLFS